MRLAAALGLERTGWARDLCLAVLASEASLPTALPRSSRRLAELLDVAEDEEVLLALVDATAAVGDRVPATWQERAAPYADLRRRLEERRDEVHEALGRAGVAHAFVKGFAVERLYGPQPLRRQFEDLDIGVDSLDCFWAAARVLEERGHRLDALALGELPGGGAASARLVAHGVPVKLHAPGFPIHDGAVLRYPARLWPRENGEPAEPPVRWQALILLAEVFDRPRLLLRDRLDADAIDHGLEHEGRAWLADQARRRGLQRELTRMWHGAASSRGGAVRRVEAPAGLRLRLRAVWAPGSVPRGRYAALALVDGAGRGAVTHVAGGLIRTPLGTFRPTAIERAPGALLARPSPSLRAA